MNIVLTDKIQVHCSDGGFDWTLVERRVSNKDGVEKENWDVIGHYGRPDQALSRALQVIVFERNIDRISLAGLVRRLEATEKRILEAIAEIDRSSYDAMVASRDNRRRTIPPSSKKDLRNAEKAIAAGAGRGSKR